MSLCNICSHPYKETSVNADPDLEDICPKCQDILATEAPGVPLYGNEGDANWDVSVVLAELERRIPGLFSGKECTREMTLYDKCSCTYKTGCQALKKIDKTPPIVL